MRNLPDLAPDCAACTGLCCMALAFDKGEDFAIDKPAGLPCPNLAADFSCAIFDDLRAQGFAGCARYSCLGAGQRVSQELFAGHDWRREPALARPMIAAFAAMRQVHEGLELLAVTQRLDLPASLAAERDALMAAYAPPDGWHEDSLARFAQSDTSARLAAFLPGLRDFV